MDKTRILIADDHHLFADGLSFILSQEEYLEVIGIAADGEELLQVMEKQAAEIVLLDVSMPRMNGLQASRKILRLYPQVRILVVTMHDTADFILPLVQEGVHGIVLKNMGKAELLKAIEQLLQGKTYFSQEIARQMAQGYRYEKQGGWQLTKREKEILQLICEGLSSAEIAEKLFISIYTAETHRKNLLGKAGVKNSAQLISRAIQLGIVKRD